MTYPASRAGDHAVPESHDNSRMSEEDPPMVLWPRIERLRDHYRDFLPRAYKELQDAGRLEHVLQNLAQSMHHGERVAIENGYQPNEAQEIVNETWLPKPEDEVESEALPSQPFYELMRDVLELQQRVLDASDHENRDASPEDDDEPGSAK
jgi:hypothetical protein